MSASEGREFARVAVIGAGYLGAELALCLSGIAPVVATTRSGSLDTAGACGLEVRPLDVIRDGDAQVSAALEGAQALVICMAAGRQQDRRALYVKGTGRILDAFSPDQTDMSIGSCRVVYISSTSALAEVEGPVDEEDERWPKNERGRVQREAEELVQARARACSWPWMVLRLGGLYGPGRGLGRIYRPDSEEPLPGDGMQATNLIHREDAIQAVIAALRAPPELSARIHVCDDDHRPRRQIYALLAESKGWPPPRWREAPKSAEARGKRVVNRRLGELLGVELRQPTHLLGE